MNANNSKLINKFWIKQILVLIFVIMFLISFISIRTVIEGSNNGLLDKRNNQRQTIPLDRQLPDTRYSLGALGPDLVFDSVSIDRDVIEYGKMDTKINFVLKNIGDVDINDTIIYVSVVQVFRDDAPHTIGGFLSVPVTPPLKPGQTTVPYSFYVGHDSNWPVGQYSLQLDVDNQYGKGFIAEADETNNLSPVVKFFVGNPGVDLVVYDLTIPTPTIVYQQTPYTNVRVTFRNNGIYPLNFTFQADLLNVTKDGLPYNPGTSFTVSFPIPLLPGQLVSYNFPVGHNSTWKPADYTILVRADSLNTIVESSEVNNISPELAFRVVVPLPDLIITDITIPTTVIPYGQVPWTWVNFTIKNNGLAPVYDSFLIGDLVDVTKDGAPYYPGGYFNITGYSTPLNPGQIATHLFAVGHDNVWLPGQYTLRVSIDSPNTIMESDESNNLSPFLSFTVVYELSDPILITSDDDFSALGFPGSGTPNDPYRIEGLAISNNLQPLIQIYNTTSYFVIIDNNLDGINGSFDGIYLENVIYGGISGNYISGALNGIHIVQSSDSSITSNRILANFGYGILAFDNEFLDISNNEVGNNGLDGIFFDQTHNSYLGGNNIYGNGFGIPIRYSVTGTVGFTRLNFFVGSGIFLDPSNNNKLESNIIYGNSLAGILLLESNGTEVYSNDIQGNGVNGVAVVDSSHGTFFGNTIVGNGYDSAQVGSSFGRFSLQGYQGLDFFVGSGIFLDPSEDNYVFDNILSDNARFGVYLLDTSSTVVEANQISGNGEMGLFVQDSYLFKILGNNIVDNGYAPSTGLSEVSSLNFFTGSGIFLDPSNEGLVAENVVANNSRNGIHLLDTTSVEIISNSFKYNGYHGVLLENSSYNFIGGNDVFENGFTVETSGITGENFFTGSGIFLDPSEGNTVSENVVVGNALHGIHLFLTNNSEVSDNEVSTNGETGVFLEDSSLNFITGNVITNHGVSSGQASVTGVNFFTGSGIFLDPSWGNEVSGNILRDNIYGVTLQGSSDNKFFANVIQNNDLYGVLFDELSNTNSFDYNDLFGNNHGEVQGYDDGEGNEFFGNYWSDWDGVGEYKLAGKAGSFDPEPSKVPNVIQFPTVIYPNGGETLEGTITVKWVAVEAIEVYYNVYLGVPDSEQWKLLEDGLKENSYNWDTTKVDNGEYLIKVVAYYDGIISEDTSDESFFVRNEVEPPTATSQSISTSPGWTIVPMIGFILLGGIYLRKRK